MAQRSVGIWALLLLLAGIGSAGAESRFEMERNRLIVNEPIYFAAGGDAIQPQSEAALQHVLAFLTDKDYVTLLRIEVHTDSSGDPEFNQMLSNYRAGSVALWLMEHGIDCQRLIAVGFSGDKPIATNDTVEGRFANRRTEFHVAALRDHLIGGLPADGGGQNIFDLCQ